jgi:hypothetical protein
MQGECKMAKETDLSTFEATSSPSSASSMQDTMQDAMQGTMQGTVSECNEVQEYSIEQIMSYCSIARRTAFKYAAEILEVWYWLPEYEFRVNGIYSEFALAELKKRKSLGTPENYRQVVHQENAEAIANWKTSQLPKHFLQVEPKVNPPEVTSGLMNLPNLFPVESSVVPYGQSLATDSNPAQDLALRSDALSQGLEEIERLKNFLKGASAVADSYIEKLEATTEEEERQAKECEELAFELEVKSDYIKRAEVRKAVVKKEAEKTKTAAASKVANFADFFARRAKENASS